MNGWPAVARRRLARTPLLVSVSFAVLTGFVLAVVVTIAIVFALGTTPTIDVLKTALTIVAGVGGAVALVVAYRRQRDLEQGRFVERFGAAAAQLGDPDVALRIAGAYAMAGVADESRDFARRQQCIDVLCGYLRLPYEPEQGSSHRTELVTTTTRQALPPITSIEEEVHQRLRQNDREVRQTIVRIIAAHLKPSAENSWSSHDYDFTGVLFEDADFQDATFSGNTTSFNEARFSGTYAAYFAGATFSGKYTYFIETQFSGKYTIFEKATFSGKNTLFGVSTFAAESTSFAGAQFSGQRALFVRAQFSGEYVTFAKSVFSAEHVSFDKSAFSGKQVTFVGAQFSGKNTYFVETQFSGESTSFVGAQFSGENVSFESPQAWTNVSFDWDRPLGADNSEANTGAAVMPECIQPRKWPPNVKASSS
jgi:uncharacterized protein YjbI with pentapeptide repeats